MSVRVATKPDGSSRFRWGKGAFSNDNKQTFRREQFIEDFIKLSRQG